METVYLPNFLKDLPDIEIFRRLEVFTNLAVKFTSRIACGKDKSVKTMKTLLEHPQLQGLTVMNNVLDLLKDVVLSYQAAQRTGNVPPSQRSDKAAAQKEKIIKFKMFPKTTRRDVSNLLKSLDDTVTEHKITMKKLRDAQQEMSDQGALNLFMQDPRINISLKVALLKKYINQQSRWKFLMRQYTGTGDAPIQDTAPETTSSTQATPVSSTTTQATSNSSLDTPIATTQAQTTQGTSKGFRKLMKKAGKQHEEAMKAYVGFKIYADRERGIRKNKLHQTETIVRTLIEDRICGILEIGHSRLTQFGKQFSLPEAVIDRLEQFDIHHVASQLYSQLSTRYIFPTVGDYADGTLIPESRFDSPNLKAQDKHDIRLGKSGRSMHLLEQEQNGNKQEELYVWASQDSGQDKLANFLNFHTGQKLKQKVCSNDGSLAFGWKRSLLGFKTYGFYPTHSVSPVP